MRPRQCQQRCGYQRIIHFTIYAYVCSIVGFFPSFYSAFRILFMFNHYLHFSSLNGGKNGKNERIKLRVVEML